MRYKQLLENKQLSSNQKHANDMFEYLKTYCRQFYELSNQFEYVPHRKESFDRSVTTDFDEIVKMDTRSTRKSKIDRLNDGNIIEMFDVISTALGNASRIHHMAASSSIGENPLFPVYDDSPKLFPIGDLKYSYIIDDFNIHTDDFGIDEAALIKHIIQTKEYSSIGPKKIFHDARTLYKFYEHTYSHETLLPLNLAGITCNAIIDLLNKIENNNYKKAFNNENEIWFNCKEYFMIRNIDYEYMMEYKTI